MIPRIIHQIWLGENIEIFDSLMDTVKYNSDIDVIVWKYDRLEKEGLLRLL